MLKKLLGLALACVLSTGAALAGEFTPVKEITVIVPSSAGGGSDLNARTIANIAQKNNFTPRSFMIVNKGGGSGAVGFTDTFAKKGDDHTLMILHSGQAMGAYVNDWKTKTEDLTFIAVVAFDNLFLAVKADSPWKTIEEFIAASKANPEEIAVGGAQRGNFDHLAFETFNAATGAGASYVSFNGSGDVMSALLGGHIDAGIFNPLEFIGQIQAGGVRPIATFAPERLGGIFKDVPTMKELGYENAVVVENRAIAGPPGMSEAAAKYYSDLLKKVTETDEWKTGYIEKNYLDPVFYDYKKTKEYYMDLIENDYKHAFKGVDMNR